MAGKKRAAGTKIKAYNFQEDWEEGFLFTLVKEKCVCLLCRKKIVLANFLGGQNATFFPPSVDKACQLCEIEIRNNYAAEQPGCMLRNSWEPYMI